MLSGDFYTVARGECCSSRVHSLPGAIKIRGARGLQGASGGEVG